MYTILEWVGDEFFARPGEDGWKEVFKGKSREAADKEMMRLTLLWKKAVLYKNGVHVARNYDNN